MGYARISDDYYVRWHSIIDNDLDDDSILFTQELLAASGFQRSVFYSWYVMPTSHEYLAWAKDPNKMFFILYMNDGVPLGLCWLTDFTNTNKQCMAHFSTLGTVERIHSVKAGRSLLASLFKRTKLLQVVGITPACYRHAVAFAKDLGFKPLYTLKEAVFCNGKDRDALLSICEAYEV